MEGRIVLLGQHEGKIDSKARCALPKAFRKSLGDALIITFGFESSLIIVSKGEWEALLEGTRGRPFIEYATRETQRFLLGGASEITLDSKGRFLLPNYLRTFAGLEKNVIFLGVSRYVEIWEKERWQKYQEKLTKNIERIAERLVGSEKKDE